MSHAGSVGGALVLTLYVQVEAFQVIEERNKGWICAIGGKP